MVGSSSGANSTSTTGPMIRTTRPVLPPLRPVSRSYATVAM
jgi:hypothetical protein